MKRQSFDLLRCLSAGALVLLLAFPAAGQSLKAGAATSNMTPDIGSPIVGGHLPVPSTHVHDDLHVRVLCFDHAGQRNAIGIRKHHIHQHHVRLYFTAGSHRVRPI